MLRIAGKSVLVTRSDWLPGTNLSDSLTAYPHLEWAGHVGLTWALSALA